mmetsp:Transcript_35225/g.26270  ORF Transcript_35225/g.26270 Transcript_35225/m.26270 type:complete len:107 (+) Transcript_35225:325-645(+)
MLKKVLDTYFGGGSASPSPYGGASAGSFSGSASQPAVGGGAGQPPSLMNYNSAQPASFLDKGANDPAVLRKMIAELEIENKKMKIEMESMGGKPSVNQFSSSFSGT